MLASFPELWQLELLDEQGLYSLMSRYDLHLHNRETIRGLWVIGLLRADRVLADGNLQWQGLTKAGSLESQAVLCDDRLLDSTGKPYGGRLASVTDPQNIQLLFHPFRFYVLYHVHRIFESRSARTQYLLWPEGLYRLATDDIRHLDEWTASSSFRDCFDRWNQICELAIALEPLSPHVVLARDVVKGSAPCEVHRNELRVLMHTVLQSTSLRHLNEIRRDLGRDAEDFDENVLIHTLVRLMSALERRKLSSRLGAAMHLLMMAEVIRREVEAALKTQLPEEDEIGTGIWHPDARLQLYGSDRVFDAERRVLRDFLVSMGLDFGLKARCYVEGHTEYAALKVMVTELDGIELINLKGLVVERNGKGVSFAESLRSNSELNVFSIVLLDSDRTDNRRAAENSARNGELFGKLFISDPDVELANFSVDELVSIAAELKHRDLEKNPLSTRDNATIYGSQSGKEIIRNLGLVGMDISKGSEWGEALMRRALLDPVLPAGHPQEGTKRPLVEVIDLLQRAERSGYVRSRSRHGGIAPETDESESGST